MAWEIERDEAFGKALKQLHKKYPKAEEDILEEFKKGPPSATDPLPMYGRKLWKGRAPCTDARKGKSHGFRIIYYWDADLPNWCCIGTAYIKAEYENLPANELATLFLSVKARAERYLISRKEALPSTDGEPPPQT